MTSTSCCWATVHWITFQFRVLHDRDEGRRWVRRRSNTCGSSATVALVRILFLGKHLHKTEHAIIDEVAPDSTDHKIGARPGKMHNFNAVLSKRSTTI